jgi:NADH:ubiquinone oxidoreductase subunit
MKLLLLQFFTWWNGATWGTRFHTWRKGEFVGDDVYGNRYYRERGGSRRWVIYSGEAEASHIPPGWYGWMHGRTDVPPPQERYEPFPWQKPHQPNLTGTVGAYRPKGSILTPERRPEVTGDYEPWRP